MVLTLRSGALGFLLGALLGIAPLGGCNQSLFDNHGPGGGGGGGGDAGGDGPMVSTSCPATCLGDAAAEFGLAPARWRYLEDQRNRTWVAMTGGAAQVTGADPGNHITACKDHRDAEACTKLPGALLVSSSAPSGADTAIEFTAAANQVIQLSLRAYLPAGAGATLQLYRNSREDALLSATLANAVTERAIVLDALAGDRFLVAITPGDGQAVTDVGLHLYASATGAAFPSTCQLAIPFASASGSTTGDLCRGSTVTYRSFASPGTLPPVSIVPGPFPEQHGAADITAGDYLLRDGNSLLDWSQDVTVQLWVQLRTLNLSNPAWLFADKDEDLCGGIGLYVSPGVGDTRLVLEGCVDPTITLLGTTSAPYPLDSLWHFLRVVYTSNRFSLCMDGKFLTSLAIPPGMGMTSNSVNLGLEPTGATGAYLDGTVDDVRAFTGALPCN